MNKRTECLSVMITKEERKALELRLYELYSKEDKKLSISDFMRGLLRADLNGGAPPDIIDDCVKEELAKMETEDNKQDNEQVAINDSKQDDEQEATDYWEGITT